MTLRAQTPPAGFTNTTVSTGWDEAVGLTFNSTGSKMFVWERPGKVWVVVNGVRQQILDISPEVGGWNDHGLLGFALDPNFDTNGYMYLLYMVDRHYLLNFGTPSYSATTNDYNTASIGRLTRYTATPAGTGYTVSLASRRILLGATKTTGIPVTSYTHSPGSLVFGADGTLLVSTGDGADAAIDPGSIGTYFAQALADGIITAKENIGSLRSQLVDCLSGKILRLNPATGDGIPSNPFYDAANPRAARSRVWALGTRNPFRMTRKPGTGSTDPAAANPGVLYLGDVGSCCWEEVNVVDRPGVNLGWPIFEGLLLNDDFYTSPVPNQDAPNPLFGVGGCTKQFFTFPELIRQATPTGTATFTNPCNAGQPVPASIPTFVHTRPLIDWGHPIGPARTGIFSGTTAATINIGASGSPVSGPQFGGAASVGGVFYPYTDFPAQYQNTYFFGDYGEGWIRSMTVNGSNQPSAVRNFVNSGAVPVAFAVSPGETGLFYVNFFPSEIRKISYITAASPPVAVASSNKTFGPAPLLVQLTGSASTNPGGGTLTYRWNFGDGTATSSAANPSHTFAAPSAAPINYTVTLTVTNGAGLTNQASLTISVNNTPPQVTITSPAAGTLYPLTGNTVYPLRATVVDAEHSGGQLAYAWQTVLYHNTHQHPDPIDTTRQTSTTIVPFGCGTETYYYVVRLTVTDAGGLATTREVRLNPDCATTSFTLVDADAPEDIDIQPLVNGSVLNLATLPTRSLNIRANANPATTGSVVFALSGAQTQNVTDSGVPYALFGDVNGDYNSWTPAVGSYVLTATPYSGLNGSGAAGPPLTISFTVTDSNPPGAFTFYRAVNLGGPALTLDGNAWAGSTAPNYSTNGAAFANQAVPLVPATDAARAGMIRACVSG
ncbi:PQQ-dependent sugar dehydrogenase, partial [Hymenobacter antarcticus]|uniref:PQQ-dependent sugar dehydrogenase n=1 Tax=Hymenobacter antarcticus TaxID=486270 RepID=UPI0031F0B843